MNLAEIRKKAQQGEQAAEERTSSGPSLAHSKAPEPPAVEAPAQEAPAEETPGRPEAGEERPQPRGELIPMEPRTITPERFDPAAVILHGRESAQLAEEGSQQEEAGTEALELLCFRVAHEEYALSIMDIKEIIKPREVTEVPRVPSFVRGILSLRGIIIPIFDMRVRLGLTGSPKSERERIVVVKRQNGFCGILVDEVVQVVRIPQDGVEPPPVVLEGIDRDFVQGIGRVGGRMLILLDMEKVLDVGLF
jgi:purine-binding chemotaxis protein CheW